jgi:predicted DsbA family dithiol-disulfide isomerase
MADLEKEIKKEEKKIEKIFEKKQIWVIISAVLFIALIVVAVWPRQLSGNAAGEKLVSFLNTEVVAGGGVSLKEVTKEGGLYRVIVIYQGQEIPVYTTLKGDYFIQGATPITTQRSVGTGNVVETPAEVPKTDKPVAEAFVFSYCPYGLQFEKALAPVYDLLKNKADINIVAIGAMHGIHEETESLRQICIQKNYGKDKLWQYLNKFMADTKIGDCNNNMNCSKPLVENIMKSLSIDISKINSCMANDAPALYDKDNQRASSLGISGSPDFVINGVDVSVGRNPEAIKQAICNAFTDSSKPAECSQTLSTASASAWFGSDSSSSSSSAQC